MANPELSRHIQALPDELNALEGGREISERLRRVDALKDRARSLEPLDGVEDMALADYDRDWLVRYTYNSNAIEGSTLTLGGHVAGVGGRVRPIGLAGQIRVRSARGR